jgi:predicted Zn-ribbon and HTH transcriptional regulator
VVTSARFLDADCAACGVSFSSKTYDRCQKCRDAVVGRPQQEVPGRRWRTGGSRLK